MLNPDWKPAETAQKKLRIITVNLKERHLDAIDMETMYPLCLDANEKIDLGKIKKAKIYSATIKIYKADLTSELEGQLQERALSDPQLLHSLKAIKSTGSKLTKYELISIKK
jgi:hypothetical protein